LFSRIDAWESPRGLVVDLVSKASSGGQGDGLDSNHKTSSGSLVGGLGTWESAGDQGVGFSTTTSPAGLVSGLDTWESSL